MGGIVIAAASPCAGPRPQDRRGDVLEKELLSVEVIFGQPIDTRSDPRSGHV
jgi:hypothetical protein